MKKPELLAPAGNLEKLKMAIIYGADAVYAGGEEFGLRASADNFSIEELAEGIKFAHGHGKKVYVTMNIFPHNKDLEGMPEFIKNLDRINADAVIISDLGVFSMVKEIAPDMDIHISTQANNTNWKSVSMWRKLGAKRVVLAREMSVDEIKEIKKKAPAGVELEVFVHGAMCISYSGRCLLSNYMIGRDSNRGECAHPCRWKYYLMEEKRPGEFFPINEDERGAYIFNSKDLCMIRHIPELMQSGISSFKIEGRMKSSYYVATIVKAYRQAIDRYYENPEGYKFDESLMEEVMKASHREYTTGFYFGKPGPQEQIYATSSYTRTYDFTGLVLDYDDVSGIATVEQRNRMETGEYIEVVPPYGEFFVQKIGWMQNEAGELIESAPHPQMIIKMPLDRKVEKYTMLRKEMK